MQDAEFNLSENRVFDFWIRIRGSHSVAFDVAFETSKFAFLPTIEDSKHHVINILGHQVFMPSLGDLGPLNDGNWHHVVFDLGFAAEAQFNVNPNTIKNATLSITDWQGGIDIFSGAPEQPIPTVVELRDLVLRPRLPDEAFSNDLAFSLLASVIGNDGDGRGRYLIGGSVTPRQALNGLRVVVRGDKGSIASHDLGSIQGRRAFTFAMTTLPNELEVKVSLVTPDGKALAERTLHLPPPLTYMSEGTINIIPNSHNDIGWLDTPAETAKWRHDKIIGPAITILEKNADYRFGMETSLFLMEYLNRAPTQAETVHQLMREGRLAFGATYNQPYPSLWRDESLIRQLYYGRKWIRENVGTDVDVVTAWGTDVPSVAMQMPQILAKSGVKYLTLGRFRPGFYDWYSPDGSKVTVGSLGVYGLLSQYLTPHNTPDMALLLPNLLSNWQDYYRTHNIPPELPISDMGDYISPTPALIPLVREWNSKMQKEFGSAIKMKFATGEELLKAVTSRPDTKLPALHGEWPNVWAYIHGPTHHEVVSAGREAVWNLTAAEKFWTLRNLASQGKEQYPRETFDQAWMAQIYPDHGFGGFNGDITDTVFLAKEKEAQLLSRTLLNSSVEWIANHAEGLNSEDLKLTILNPLSWDRTGPVAVEIPTPSQQEAVIVNARGEEVTSQRVPQVQGGTSRYILEARDIPAIGYSTFAVRFRPRAPESLRDEEFKTKVFENEFYRLEFEPGGLKSIFDKQLGKELIHSEKFLAGEVFMLNSEGNGAHEEGDFQHASWKEIEKSSQYYPTWQVIESGPVRMGWRLDQPFRQATVREEIYAYAKSKRLDFDVHILHWSGEKNLEFRVAFPANVPNGQVTYEVPYGVLEVNKDEIDARPYPRWYDRPAREIHPREVQDWISAGDGTFGVMLSSSVAVWDFLDSDEKKDRFTLLQPILLASRKSVHTRGNWYLQKGDHDYHFSLTSFAGDWRNSFRFGNEVNSPFPSAVASSKALEPPIPSALSFCQVSQPNYIISTIKVADDQNGIIVRGYEISGRDGEVVMKFPLRIDQANATSLIEENLGTPVTTSAHEVQSKVGQRSIDALRIVGRWSP